MKRKKVSLGKILLLVALAAVAVFAGMQAYSLLTVKSSGNDLGFRVTIVHTDGTMQVLDSRDYETATLINAATGKPVSSVQVELYIIPVFSGTVSSYSVSGTLRMQMQYVNPQLGTVVSYDSGDVALQPMFTPQLQSGKAVVITSATLSASQLEALIKNPVDNGNYRFVYTCKSLTLNVNFADGTQASKAASNLPSEAVVGFTYKAAAAASYLSDVTVQFNINAG